MNKDQALLEGELAINRKYPGACDEIWFCDEAFRSPEDAVSSLRSFARYRELCEKSGARLSYQQGWTLGHGLLEKGGMSKAWKAFSEDAWQIGKDGKRLIGLFCPRSPEVLAYERAYAKAIVATAHPWSFWLDDDLRMGVCKLDGCFCDRCIAAFNAKTGGSWTHETLVGRLYGKSVREPVRAAWIDFNQESLALFAEAARQGAAEADPSCRMAYQAVWSDTIYTGRDNRKLLAALSGPDGRPVGIRPGAGIYHEAEPRKFVAKALGVAREAERCRNYGFVGSICYEQETYPRRILQKSPGAVVTECSLALASGCTSLSLYWYIGENPQPLGEYERGARAISAARPYFERLVASVRRTRLAGVSRFIGSAAAEASGFDLRDPADLALALAGVPVTVAEAGYPLWYLTAKSRREMTPEDEKTVAGKVVTVPKALFAEPVPGFLRARERTALLDEIDRVTAGRFPVRLEECRPVRILPRATTDGRLDSVTLLNCSIGETDELTLKVRNPTGPKAELMIPRVHLKNGETLRCEPSERLGEWIVKVPSLGPWCIGTVFFASGDPISEGGAAR